jgi:isoleucyl-tRNA synthetase
MSISDEILKRVVESYRRMRNTLRFLLANLTDFDPKSHSMPVSDWLEMDRYSLALAADLQKTIEAHYRNYEFHPAVSKILGFCSEDLGGFYLDILKDRLYTMAPNSPGRRSAQNALFHITQHLLKWLSPFLSFTAEEAWQSYPHFAKQPKSPSIFTEQFGSFPDIVNQNELLQKWQRIREIRSEITKAIEVEREAGKIGSSLQAELSIEVAASDFALLNSLGVDLRFVTITSKAEITQSNSNAMAITVKPSTAQKCARCWHHTSDVGSHSEHPDICGRCISNLYGEGEKRQFI